MSKKWKNVAIGGGIAVAAAGLGYGLSELGIFSGSTSTEIAGLAAGTAGSAFSDDPGADAIPQPSPTAAAPKARPADGAMSGGFFSDVILGIKSLFGMT
jgi:hypothetical protein